MDCWYIVITVVAWIVAIKMILGEKDDQLLILCRVGHSLGLVVVYADTRMELPRENRFSATSDTYNSNGYICNL